MKNESDVMRAMGEANIIPMMLLLYEQKKVIQSELAVISKGIPKLHKTAEKLQALGLLKIHIVNRPYRTVNYIITKKGEELAQTFLQAKDIVLKD